MTLIADFSDEYRAEMARTFWPGRTLLDYFDEAVAAHPDRLAVIGYVDAVGGRYPLTYAELAERVDRIAAGLLDLGVAPGQVVSAQLPNWWQLAAVHLACLRVGAVTNALMSIFRKRELTFMLGLAESVVFLTPETFNGFDHAALAADLQAELPGLTHVVAVRPDGGGAFDEILGARTPTEADRAEFTRRAPSPDDVTQLAYTSGTTGEPKGVMVTSNMALCNVRDFADRLGITAEDTVLMASPLAHQTGFLYGLMMPILRGTPVVLQDVWRAARATEIIRDESVTFSMASTPFLTDLTAQAETDPDAFSTFRLFLCAGAPVPRDLVRRATKALNARISSGWGMSEMGAVTVTGPDDPDERVFETDGSPLPGVELRILGLDGTVAGHDEEGRLQLRADSLFGGYLKRPDLRGLDAEGWFDTGDLARIDAEGYLRITGRSKDIIIRGGENIPVVEIENLIYGHPDVAEVALVAMPDARLGERACAFVVPRPGAEPLTLDVITAHLLAEGTARQYLPERLETVDALPRTLTGKIQKFKLREQAALWNGGSGNAWVELREVLDGMLAPLGQILLDSVDVQPDDHVLDVGCGTGATTVDVAGQLGPRGRSVGIDISAAMLDAARVRAEQSGRAAHFVLGDVQTYPFEPAQFDAVISRLGVMFFDDPVEAFKNLHRAARPGAQLRFLAWRGAAANPFMTTAERAAAPLLPQLPARDPDAPGQFAFADGRRVERILGQSGWTEIDVRPVDLPCAMPEDQLMRYVASMGPVGRILSQADDQTRDRVLPVVRAAFDPFVHDSEVRYTAACWLVAASRA